MAFHPFFILIIILRPASTKGKKVVDWNWRKRILTHPKQRIVVEVFMCVNLTWHELFLNKTKAHLWFLPVFLFFFFYFLWKISEGMICFGKILIFDVIQSRLVSSFYAHSPRHCLFMLSQCLNLLLRIVIWYNFFLFQYDNFKGWASPNIFELLLICFIVLLILRNLLFVVFDNIAYGLKVGLHLFMMIPALIRLACLYELGHYFKHFPWTSFLFDGEFGLKVLEEDKIADFLVIWPVTSFGKDMGVSFTGVEEIEFRSAEVGLLGGNMLLFGR